MSSQIRLRLTGSAGGGTCVLMEEGGRLRYRLSLEGPPGGGLEALIQGRSPYMELTRQMVAIPAFTGRWQTEGECESLPCAMGWIWILRGGEPWLMGAFPGVSTPPEAALQALTVHGKPSPPSAPPSAAGRNTVQQPNLLIPLPGVTFAPGMWAGRSCFVAEQAEPGRRWTLIQGEAGEDPFEGEGIYCAAAGDGGYWLQWQNVTEL